MSDADQRPGEKSGRAASPQNDVPMGFTLALALVDAIPVALFCASATVFGARVQSPLFVAGAVAAFLGGAGKVCWKLLIALAHKNVFWLNRQMRFVMPAGFALMVVGAAVHAGASAAVLAGLTHLPSLALLLVCVACMCAMGYFAGHRDQTDVRSNWIEQLTNACGQAALLAALLLA